MFRIQNFRACSGRVFRSSQFSPCQVPSKIALHIDSCHRMITIFVSLRMHFEQIFPLTNSVSTIVINIVPYQSVPAIPYHTGQKRYTLISKIVPVKYRPVPVCTIKYRAVPVFSVKYRSLYANLNEISNVCTLIFLYFLKFKTVRTRYTNT